MSRFFNGLRQRLALSIWGEAPPNARAQLASNVAAVEESAEFPQSFVVQDGQLPNYTPFPSRFIEVDVARNQRPVALINVELANALQQTATGTAAYQQDYATMKFNFDALEGFRDFFEAQEQETSRTVRDMMRQTPSPAGLEAAQRRQTRLRRKLRQLDADDEELRQNNNFIAKEAATHLQGLMAHIQPLLVNAGILPVDQAPDDRNEVAAHYRRRYRLATGDDASSDGSHSSQEPEPATLQPESTSSRRLQQITARRRAQYTDDSVHDSPSGLSDQHAEAERQRQIDLIRERNAVNVQRMEQERRRGTGIPNPMIPRPDRPGPLAGLDRSNITAQNGSNVEDPDSPAAPIERTPRQIAADDYRIRRQELQEAQDNFDNRQELMGRDVTVLLRQIANGEADADDLAQFEIRDFARGRTLTRNLITAEQRLREAKLACQNENVNLLDDDDMSSLFPDISDDDSANTEGVPTAEQKEDFAPATIEWCRTLPDLVDTVLAEQDEWTRRPEVDEWEAAPIMDYDSISLRGQGKKRKRIDAVLEDNRALHDQAVADWVKDTNKRQRLFHEQDRVLVFSKGRE